MYFKTLPKFGYLLLHKKMLKKRTDRPNYGPISLSICFYYMQKLSIPEYTKKKKKNYLR